MATTEKLQFIIDAINNTKEAFKSIESSLGDIKTKNEQVQKSMENFTDVSKKMATIGAVGLATIGAVAVKTFKDFSDAEAQTAITTKSLENTLSGMTEKQFEMATGFVKSSESIKLALDDTIGGAIADISKKAISLGFDDEATASSFAKLLSASKNTSQAMKEVGIAQDLARYKGISLEQATKSLTLVHSGATKELKLLGLAVDDNATPMENMDRIMKQVAGSSEAFANTSAGAMEILSTKISNLSETIGGALQPVFIKLLDAVKPIIDKFSAWAEQNPELLARIILITGAVSGLLVVFGTLGAILPAIITGFSLLTSPIGLIVIAIVGLIAGITYLISNFDKVKQKASEVWDKISEVWDSMKSFISTKIDEIKIKLQEFWDTWGNIITGIVGFITGLYLPKIALMAFTTGVELAKMVASWIVNTASIVAQIAIQTVTAIPGLIMQYGAMAFTALTTGATVVGQWVLMAGTAMLQAVQMAAAWLIAFGPIAIITGIVVALVALIVKNWTLVKTTTIEVFTAIGEFFTELWDGIVNKTKAFIDKIKNFLQPIVDMINSVIDGLQRIGQGVGGKIKNLFGGGKNKSVNDAIISPNGNIITTHPDDYIMAMKDPSLLAGGAGGINITITGNSFMGKENIAEQIGNDIMKIVKQNMKL